MRAHSSISNSEAAAMPQTDADRMRRRFPLAAIAAVLLIILFEVMFVWHNRYHFWDANYVLLDQKKQAMTGDRPPDDVVILGSSRFYHVNPEPISELFHGAQVMNYAWGYCGVEAYEGMLRGLIDAGRVPSLILVDGAPEVFAYRPDTLTISQNPGLRVGFSVTVPPMAALRTEAGQKAWNTTWEIFTQYMTPPSTLYRDQIKTQFPTLLKGHLPPLPPQYDRLVTTWKKQGWFYFVKPNQVVDPAEFKMLEENTGPYVLRSNADIIYSYGRFIRLAKEHNVQVVILPVPNNEYAFEKFTDEGVYQQYDTWLNKLEAKYPNFHAPGPRWFYWPGALGDALHVNAKGAARHMQLILKQLDELDLPGVQNQTALDPET